jgi:hypothetical protein
MRPLEWLAPSLQPSTLSTACIATVNSSDAGAELSGFRYYHNSGTFAAKNCMEPTKLSLELWAYFEIEW